MKVCTRCKQQKPGEEFNRDSNSADGLSWWCRDCHAEYKKDRLANMSPEELQRERERKAAVMRNQRAKKSPEEKRAEMAAYRAGMRQGKCAVCAGEIEGHGICKRCMDAIKVLGGTPEDLKRAAKALKYLQE